MRISKISKRTGRTICIYDLDNECKMDSLLLAELIGCDKLNILCNDRIVQENATHVFIPLLESEAETNV